MDKEKLKEIIIKEEVLNEYYCLKTRELIADNILTKIPDDDFILKGKGRLMAYSEEEMFLEYEKGCVHFFNNKDLYKHKGKKIEIGIRVTK